MKKIVLFDIGHYESEQFTKELIFEESPLGVALIESITGKIIDVNTHFSEIAGRSKSELKNLSWMDLTHPDDLDNDLNKYKDLNNGK